jgi:hypothetical protein
MPSVTKVNTLAAAFGSLPLSVKTKQGVLLPSGAEPFHQGKLFDQEPVVHLFSFRGWDCRFSRSSNPRQPELCEEA